MLPVDVLVIVHGYVGILTAPFLREVTLSLSDSLGPMRSKVLMKGRLRGELALPIQHYDDARRPFQNRTPRLNTFYSNSAALTDVVITWDQLSYSRWLWEVGPTAEENARARKNGDIKR